jgi:hypothetical protein
MHKKTVKNRYFKAGSEEKVLCNCNNEKIPAKQGSLLNLIIWARG